MSRLATISFLAIVVSCGPDDHKRRTPLRYATGTKSGDERRVDRQIKTLEIFCEQYADWMSHCEDNIESRGNCEAIRQNIKANGVDEDSPPAVISAIIGLDGGGGEIFQLLAYLPNREPYRVLLDIKNSDGTIIRVTKALEKRSAKEYSFLLSPSTPVELASWKDVLARARKTKDASYFEIEYSADEDLILPNKKEQCVMAGAIEDRNGLRSNYLRVCWVDFQTVLEKSRIESNDAD